MNANEFQLNFQSLINGAIKDGVPLPNLILVLSSAEFEIQMMWAQLRQHQAQSELASKIIPAGHINLNRIK